MKMAKPSERDINAAGNAMSLLNAIDRGYYPARDGQEDAPDWFDEDDPEHLRRFYDAMMETLKAGPGWPGRVIGGMCYVIMLKENEILDPESDVIDLHPKFIKQEEQLAAARALLRGMLGEAEGWHDECRGAKLESLIANQARSYLDACGTLGGPADTVDSEGGHCD